MRVPVQNGVAEETRECGMTLWMSECLCGCSCSHVWTKPLLRPLPVQRLAAGLPYWLIGGEFEYTNTRSSCFHSWSRTCWLEHEWQQWCHQTGRGFFFFIFKLFFFQGRADRLKSLQHSGWSQARKGEEETRVCVRGQVREGKEKKGGEKEDGEGDRKREDVRHAASMQVYYEKRCLRRQASEDGSSSASDALHHIRLSARELYSRTHRHCKSSVATRGVYVTDLLFSNLRAAINIQRLKKKKKMSGTSLLCPDA